MSLPLPALAAAPAVLLAGCASTGDSAATVVDSQAPDSGPGSGAATADEAGEDEPFAVSRVVVEALHLAVDEGELRTFRWQEGGEELGPRVHLALLDSRYFLGADPAWRCDWSLALQVTETLPAEALDGAAWWAWQVQATTLAGDCPEHLDESWLARLNGPLVLGLGPLDEHGEILPDWFENHGLDWAGQGEPYLFGFWLGPGGTQLDQLGYASAYSLDADGVVLDDGGALQRQVLGSELPAGAVYGVAYEDVEADVLLP